MIVCAIPFRRKFDNPSREGLEPGGMVMAGAVVRVENVDKRYRKVAHAHRFLTLKLSLIHI